jgi:hypothetical protein
MPLSPDSPCTVIDGDSGFVTENKSWILGRIVRDFEIWMDQAVVEKLEHMKLEMIYSAPQKVSSNGRIGLCVSVFEPDFTMQAGLPTRGRSLYIGLLVILLQLGIASIPYGIYGDWSVLLLTAAGNALALLTTSLPEWRREKLAYGRNSKRTSVLTTTGGQHAIVVRGNGRGLELQDLAMGIVGPMTLFTKCIILTLAVFWVAFLITASNEGVGTWFLMAVGAIGTMHNWYAGNVARNPGAFGIHLRLKEVIGRVEVMDTLYEVEEIFPRLGRSMLQTYFPGHLREEDVTRWKELEKRAGAKPETRKWSSLTASVSSPTQALGGASGRFPASDISVSPAQVRVTSYV